MLYLRRLLNMWSSILTGGDQEWEDGNIRHRFMEHSAPLRSTTRSRLLGAWILKKILSEEKIWEKRAVGENWKTYFTCSFLLAFRPCQLLSGLKHSDWKLRLFQFLRFYIASSISPYLIYFYIGGNSICFALLLPPFVVLHGQIPMWMNFLQWLFSSLIHEAWCRTITFMGSHLVICL